MTIFTVIQTSLGPNELAQNEARVGVLAASVIAFALATIIFRISDAVRPDDDSGQTLARPVDPLRDHVLGEPEPPYTIVEYGDFQCGFCLKASGSILEVRDMLGDHLRYVWSSRDCPDGRGVIPTRSG